MDALQTCYSKITTVFGTGGSSYDQSGHRGTDYSVQDGWVYAYDDMTIESVDHGSGLGYSVGLRRLTIGGFCGFAHIKNLQGSVGTRIPKGGRIAQCAEYADDHGSLWNGPHKHTTQGTVSAYNCSVGIRPLSDPASVIASAVATSSSPAGGATTPITITSQGDEMIRIQATNRGIALIGPGYFRGLTSNEEVNNSGGLISAHLTGNDREFDLWVSMAYGGQSSNSSLDAQNAEAISKDWAAQVEGNEAIKALGTVDLGKVDTEGLSVAIAAKLGNVGGLSPADKAEILSAISFVDENTLATLGLKRA